MSQVESALIYTKVYISAICACMLSQLMLLSFMHYCCIEYMYEWFGIIVVMKYVLSVQIY